MSGDIDIDAQVEAILAAGGPDAAFTALDEAIRTDDAVGALSAAQVVEIARLAGDGHDSVVVSAALWLFEHGELDAAGEAGARVRDTEDPRRAALLSALGSVAWGQGDLTDAFDLLKESFELEPDGVNRAGVYAQLLIISGAIDLGRDIVEWARENVAPDASIRAAERLLADAEKES